MNERKTKSKEGGIGGESRGKGRGEERSKGEIQVHRYYWNGINNINDERGV